jgi:hypothetical protein
MSGTFDRPVKIFTPSSHNVQFHQVYRSRFPYLINIQRRIFNADWTSFTPVEHSTDVSKDLSEETAVEPRDLVKRIESIWLSFMKFDIYVVARYTELWKLTPG